MKKTISTFALCLTIAALTACSSSTARGESAGATSLDATDVAAECPYASSKCDGDLADCPHPLANGEEALKACCDDTGDTADS